jgi:hypothetical protein
MKNNLIINLYSIKLIQNTIMDYRQESTVRSIVREELNTQLQWDYFRGILDKMNMWSTIDARVDSRLSSKLPTQIDDRTRDTCAKTVPLMVHREMAEIFPKWLSMSGEVQKLLGEHLVSTKNLMETEKQKAIIQMQHEGEKMVTTMGKKDTFNPIYQKVISLSEQYANTAVVNVKQEFITKFTKELDTMKYERNKALEDLAQKTEQISQMQRQISRNSWMSGISTLVGVSACLSVIFLK